MAERVVRMPMTKARRELGALVRGVHVNGDIVVLEKDGIPVAGLIDIDVLEDYLDASDPELRQRIQESMTAFRAGRTRPVREFLAELEAEESK